MPPKKRKSEIQDDDNLTDEEKNEKPTGLMSKRGRQATSENVGKETNNSNLKYDLEWIEYGEKSSKNIRPLVYLWSKTLAGSEKIAAFDIDGTIIVTKSGKTFPTNAQDWKWFDKSLPGKLKDLNDKEYRIVFMTNQAGIEKGKSKLSDLKSKFESMVKELDIPIFVLIATGETHYRKPSTEMWNFFVKNCNKSVEIKMDESFYCGDAAGRPKGWAPGKSKDFSCADRMFAANVGLKFLTPEEFFLNHKPVKFEWGSIDPNEVIKKHNSKTEPKEYHSSEQEIILLTGPPASGKSSFFKKYLKDHGYIHVNRDTLSTQEKCIKATEQGLKEGKSVCIDNTNPSKKTRADFINLAKKYNLKNIRCFKLTTPIDLCHHLNYVRQNHSAGKIRRIPDVVYNMYKSQFEEPDKSEGFTEILEIGFRPDFEDEHHEKIFKQWTN